VRGRTTIASAAVAAGAVAAGLAGRVRRRRRGPVGVEGAWAPPPDDLGIVEATDGTKLAVRAAGPADAPVLLFSHGFSLDMTVWREQWVDLARDFRCVLFDHRAHGRSEVPVTADVSLRTMGRDLASVLDAVSPEAPAVLIGHSMGGMAILALADERPDLFGERIAGIATLGAAASHVLHDAMGGMTELVRPRRASVTTAARRVDRVRRMVLAAPHEVPATMARLTQFAPDAPDEIVDHVLSLGVSASSLVWTEGLSELMRMDVRGVLPRVTVPVLVAVGDQDRVTAPAAAVRLAAALPDGRLFIVEGAGHLPMLERPERVNRALRSFARSALGLELDRRAGEGAA
jgi:pimeloyl-ACP methyl ester carboxylesterase